MRKKAYYYLAAVCVVSILLVAPVFAVKGKQARAEWRSSTAIWGIPSSASGSIIFNVDPGRGTFTCSVTGSGKVSGTTNLWGVDQHINATVDFSQTSCSGTYFPEQGTISGNAVITGAYTSTASYVSSDGKPLSETRSGVNTYSGSIYGDISSPGSTGVAETGDFPVSWTVTMGVGQPEPIVEGAPAQPAQQEPAPAVAEQYTTLWKDAKDSGVKGTDGQPLGFSAFLETQINDPKELEAVKDAMVIAALAREDEREAALKNELAPAREEKVAVTSIMEAAGKLEAAGGEGEEIKKGIVAAGVDKIKEVAWSWTKEVIPEKLAEKLEGASELKGKIDNVIDNYKEIKAVQEKFNALGEQVKTGDLTRGQGEALKGGAFIGYGLQKLLPDIPGVKSTVTRMFDGFMKLGNGWAIKVTQATQVDDKMSDKDLDKVMDHHTSWFRLNEDKP